MSNVKLSNKRFLAIEELYAFVAMEKDGEGILGMLMPNNQWIPFIGADMERVNQLRPFAEKIAEVKGIKYEVRKFKLAGNE